MFFVHKTYRLLLLCAAAFSLCGFSQIHVMGGGMDKCIEGNKKRESQQRKLQHFKKLHIEGAFTVKVEGSKASPLVIVSAENNLLEHIVTKVKDNTLFISAQKPICASTPINVSIETEFVDSISLDGSSDLNYTAIQGQKLKIDMDGSGTAILAGDIKEFKADVKGASELLAEKLIAKEADVTSEGASSVHIQAKEKLKAVSSGASTILYSGSPSLIHKDESGASEIIPYSE